MSGMPLGVLDCGRLWMSLSEYVVSIVKVVSTASSVVAAAPGNRILVFLVGG
jgi:hypothetical protein